MQRAYLMELSGLFDPAYVRGEKRMGDEEATTALGRVAGLVVPRLVPDAKPRW